MSIRELFFPVYSALLDTLILRAQVYPAPPQKKEEGLTYADYEDSCLTCGLIKDDDVVLSNSNL